VLDCPHDYRVEWRIARGVACQPVGRAPDHGPTTGKRHDRRLAEAPAQDYARINELFVEFASSRVRSRTRGWSGFCPPNFAARWSDARVRLDGLCP